MPTQTTNLDLTLPTPDVDTGWGTTLNTDFVKIDDIFDADGGGTSVGLNIGDTKTAVLRGTLILGDGDGTNTTSAPTIRGPARTGSNVTGSNIRFDASNGTGTGGSGDFIFRTAAPGSSGSTATTLENVFTIKNDGNVGIGSSNPGSALVINRSTAVNTFAKTVNSAGSGYVGTDTDGRFRVWADSNDGISIGTNDVERFRIGNNGELGISTTVSSVTTVDNGTAGQVLKSNGNNAQPSWVNPGFSFISYVPFSGANSVSLTGLSDYTALRITITDLNPSVTAVVSLQFYTGSSYVTTNYTMGFNWRQYAGSLAGASNVLLNASQLTPSGYTLSTSASLNGVLNITNFNIAKPTGISGSYNCNLDTTGQSYFILNGIQNSNTAFSGFRLILNGTATLSGGGMIVEGIKSA